MSLYEPPILSVSAYAPCTCGLREGLYHADTCAKVDESHPAREKARETVKRNAAYWYGTGQNR